MQRDDVAALGRSGMVSHGGDSGSLATHPNHSLSTQALNGDIGSGEFDWRSRLNWPSAWYIAARTAHGSRPWHAHAVVSREAAGPATSTACQSASA